jgi:acetate kinase
MASVILVINAGSSSLKFSGFAPAGDADPEMLFKGQVERIGTAPRLTAHDAAGALLVDETYDNDAVRGHDGAIAAVSARLREFGAETRLAAAGHRVVHGGAEFAKPVLVDDTVLAKLEKLVPIVPLHQPANLAGIRALRAQNRALPQVACFDTAFHRGHSEIVERFALPEKFYRDGIRRYGFHGLSYEYIARKLPAVAPDIAAGRVIVAHLGSGASLCALKGGRSIDSTMAFTALDGLPMGTRCGALDPGVVIYLIRDKGMSPGAVEQLLYYECGLRGLSGLSNDARDLEVSDDPAAKLALDYFAHQVCRQIGALAAELEGLDAIVFTAGIGENSATMRRRILARLSWLGLRLDDVANRAGGPCISDPGSAVSAWVIPTNEELVIARHTQALVRV